MKLNLDEKKKQMLWLVAMGVVVYLAYALSFKKTLAAIVLNGQLKNQQQTVQSFDGSFAQTNHKHHFYTNLLKTYQVKADDRENRLWQAISGVAIAKNVNIRLSPNQTAMVDSAAIKRYIFKQQFSFKGDYFSLIKLLDSLSKSPEIGKIAALSIAVPKTDKDETRKIQLNLTVNGIVKSLDQP